MPNRKGVPNKNKQALIILLQNKYPGYHPVLSMATIAHETDDPQLAAQMHKEVAQYVTPKLKAIEHSGGIDKTIYKTVTKRFDGGTDADS